MMKRFLVPACPLVVFGIWAHTAASHHSFSQFANTEASVTGTVRAFEWANPHVWLWVDVPDKKNGSTAYGFEGSAPGEMTRMGKWEKHTVNPGDKVTVQYKPLRDGRPGGSFTKVTLPDGRVFGFGPQSGTRPGGAEKGKGAAPAGSSP